MPNKSREMRNLPDMRGIHYFFILILLCFSQPLLSQDREKAIVIGRIIDAQNNEAVDLVTVYLEGTSIATESNRKGDYRIEVPARTEHTLVFSRIGYKEARANVPALREDVIHRIDIELPAAASDVEVVVRDKRIENLGMVREKVQNLKLLPSTTGNFESVLPSIALGTTSGTGGELSSQYQVRGGNYDENLVYVNDFEIYRPQLIRAGQQEGLTFPNIDLIRDLSFSSGGFQAKYGDKLSSVLDINYKRPDSIRSSVGLSFLGGSAHTEGSMPVGNDQYRRFRYLLGARYKTTRYLLGSLDTEGEYTPSFWDFQGYFTLDLSRDLQLGWIANYNQSNYEFIPESRNTALGLIDFALQLRSEFDGREVDDFASYMSGLHLTYLPERNENPFFLKFMVSGYLGEENETFDIIGAYRLSQIETDFGSNGFGDEIALLGTGTQQEFVRNYLDLGVVNAQIRGGLELNMESDKANVSTHFLQGGIRVQHEEIEDEINEWERLDSAGYSLSYDPEQVLLRSVLKTRNDLSSNRYQAFFQDTYTHRIDGLREWQLTAGVRAAYWDLNEEFIVSPRAQFLYKPLKWEEDISFRMAAGYYMQSPFYREMRRPDGTVNTDLLSQKSFHLVGGMTWDFRWDRVSKKPFRFIAEVYYKDLWDLVSYEIDNVRIRYSGENDATGYVMGIDLRLNGEFVPGAESWINLSLLRARENLNGIQHLKREIGDEEAQEVSDVPRPTDQVFTLSMFFQDYLPRNENFKMHLNFTVGTGFPYGLKDNNRVFRNTYRFAPYHRVDIGFSVLLYDVTDTDRNPNHFLGFSRSTWLSLEVFNLMKVQNVASNTWIKTIFNRQYAVPNYLTSRRINLRLKMNF